jgi:hypothetical protein
MTQVSELRADDFLRLGRETALADELRDLARCSIEPNVFYEDWMLLPALRLLCGTSDIRLICVRNDAQALVALFPVELVRHGHFGSLKLMRLWRHSYCFLCTPLIHGQHVVQCADALAGWLQSPAAPAALLEFHSCALDGVFGSSFLPALCGRPGWVSDASLATRALLTRGADLSAGFSAKHRKDLRRIERRLGELGPLRFSVLQAADDCEPWIDRFLSLESAGWKGRSRTALDSADEHRTYFRIIAAEAHRQGRLQLLALEAGGAMVAMKCNFLAAPGSFAFKIAYDETYAKYSPGLLLELFNTEHVLTSCPQIAWMDSCADPGQFMIERLWPGRRRIGRQLVCGRGLMPRAVVLAAPVYRSVMGVIRRPRRAAAGRETRA